MRLVVLASVWSFGSLDECLDRVRFGPFDGVEGPAPTESSACRSLRRRLAEEGAPFLAEICTGGAYAPPSSVSESTHFSQFERQLGCALEAGAFMVNCLTGSDSWPTAQVVDYLGRVLEYAESSGAQLSVETHRGRPTSSPWTTYTLLNALPSLQLTCDFSHWCVVCERLVDDPDVLTLATARARHVHARVGYAQGPQVPDPRAPEHRVELLAHEGWWSDIWKSARERGVEVMPLTPEFGPDGYLHQLPFSGVPVADLAEINTWMAERQRARFNEDARSEQT